MKIKLLFVFVLSVLSIHMYAQVQVHTEMKTLNWSLIAMRYEKQVKPLQWVTVFPAELKALNNRYIELPGYIIPTKVGNRFSEFMLSVVPIESCPFCGSGDIPAMVEVKMQKPLTWTDKPIRLKGRFLINASGDQRSEFFLLDAEQL